MTVKDIFNTSVVLVTGESEAPEYEGVAVPLFNLCLGRCFKENNHLRMVKGKEKLDKPVYVKSLDEEVPYEEEFFTGLTYGLAAEIMTADSDMDEGKHSIYMQIFTDEVNKWGHVAIEESVVDVYAEY